MSLLNKKLLREAREEVQRTVKSHQNIREQVQHESVALFEQRKRAASEVVETVEIYVNNLANTPKEFDKTVAYYRVETDRFDQTIDDIKIQEARVAKIGTATGVAGAGTGIAVATLGPTAAMAVATTFGTASTGTAITLLSGAAATNAALAWLGGGALAAGGGGMAAGSAFLALAGPVGWGIGGAAVIGTAAMVRRRNRKLTEKCTTERMKIEGEIRSLQTARKEIRGLAKQTQTHSDGVLDDLAMLQQCAPSDYRKFDKSAKERLAAVINHIQSLGKLLHAEVAL